MKKLKVYFDFLCPYCYEGLMDLFSLMPEFPDIILDFNPCEAHPRPERRDQYSDLAAEAVLYLKGHGGDNVSFITKVYKAWYEDHKRIDERELLVELAKDCGVELARLSASLLRRDYKQDVMANNSDIWDVYCADAVPSYYFRSKTLESKENQMIKKEDLKAYLLSL